jgi:hypothetical protein
MPGMGHDAKWWAQYEALRRSGHSKESAARITNSDHKESKRGGKRRTRGTGKPGHA